MTLGDKRLSQVNRVTFRGTNQRGDDDDVKKGKGHRWHKMQRARLKKKHLKTDNYQASSSKNGLGSCM